MKSRAHHGIPFGYRTSRFGIPCRSRDDLKPAPSPTGIPSKTSDSGSVRYTTRDHGGIPSMAVNGIPRIHYRYTNHTGGTGIPYLQMWYTALITVSILALIPMPYIVGAEDYIFPRSDGSHFIFETDWENNFEKTQHDNDFANGQHSFSIVNLSLPVEIQFKRLALASNNCYRNESWYISVILSEGPQVVKQLEIGDTRTEGIKIQPGIRYNLTFIIQYDKEKITPGKHWAMIQMNVIAQNVDEPHYFFQIINYRRLNTQAQPFSPAIPLIFAMMGIVVVIYFVRRQTLYRKEGQIIESLPETKDKE